MRSRSLPALALALALAAAPRAAAPAPGVAFHLDDVPVGVRLELVAEPAAPSPALAWRTEGLARVGEGGDGRVRATVRVTPAGPGRFALAFSVTWRVAALVEREAVVLALPGAARAVGRDLQLLPLTRPARVDRGAPLWAQAGDVVVAAEDGFAAARYLPSRGPGGDRLEVDLVLDDAAAHPFAVYPTCLGSIPGLAEGTTVNFAALEHKTFMGRTPRAAGERVEGRALLHLLPHGAAAAPLGVERWAAGARAAIVFTDHADRTDPQALRALLHGASAPPAPGAAPAHAGFLGRGLKLTKSFFLRAHRGGLDDDPEAAALAAELRAAGSEVASHSITGEPDGRAAVQAALPSLRRHGIVTWIDHEPYTNCEAVSNQGWKTTGPYGIRDLLVQAGVRWVWEAGDVGGFHGAQVEDLFTARGPEAAARFYPLPLDPRLWVFDSTMFYAPPAELAAALSDAALDRLEATRGIFVAHTYLSASARTTSRPEHRARLVVREVPGGGLVLDPAFDAALGRLERRVRAGRLASLTWAEAGDRLRALAGLRVSYLPDGGVQVENPGDTPLPGLTLAAPPGLALAVAGAPVGGAAPDGARQRVWVDLPAGGRLGVRASRGGAPAPFLPARAGARLSP